MSDVFDRVIVFTLDNEGGYCNNPSDPGGETNFGITKKSYPFLDIKNLTKKEATDIYKRDYWDPYEFDEINDFFVCRKFFDMSVNMGYSKSAKLLQKAQGKLNVDGIIGPVSLEKINCDNQNDLLARYKSCLAKYYKDLASASPSLEKFLNGWIRRAYL